MNGASPEDDALTARVRRRRGLLRAEEMNADVAPASPARHADQQSLVAVQLQTQFFPQGRVAFKTQASPGFADVDERTLDDRSQISIDERGGIQPRSVAGAPAPVVRVARRGEITVCE